jgi:ABC-type arginine transport system permease subunit
MLDLSLVTPAIWIVALILPLKIFACWEASKRDHLGWFVLFFLVWLYGIPELVYLIKFRKYRLY